ncbi:MAG: hypothetical protein B7Y07_03790 [Halothiobacillus sp. 24-54-40]|jgi:uncharacterized membrane protein YedE/YeeE|nr:YeeE/YedE family protein [Halothiobacillaceae bacterium]OYY39833.1 MAG: hypothetical protein B7Y58_04875 [Halothiobacillus sp. 35-54-62]OYY53906.1 MAG: hypothetical protein B7Y53_07000 [Halothiobacillus sp. 28-55-5]OYZ87550.1 MAG: hypothetical protein B7Y07_03790 [Halothiobacillus sp. 24-54-40]OZA80947.1 MAG: hypothetical protein B7X64_03730 [Halothiobacillus sp. 39-53-45]HQS03205.1 hypothetical protein [Halothiobacillus sp.]
MNNPSPIIRNGSFLLFGIVFGFLLSRAGATDPALISSLLLFQNLHLLWVIGTAVGVGAVLNLSAKIFHWRNLSNGQLISFPHKPFVRALIPGALLFGTGWGLTGVCPGTAPAMLGEGQWFVGVILMGIVLGTWLVGLAHHKQLKRIAKIDRHPSEIHPR